MISDILHDAIHEIENWQRDFPESYDSITDHIELVKTVMASLMNRLDESPDDYRSHLSEILTRDEQERWQVTCEANIARWVERLRLMESVSAEELVGKLDDAIQRQEAMIAMTFFHRTSAARQILEQGFQDREALYGVIGTNRTFRGVWLSDRPLDAADCVDGDTLLKIVIPEHLVAEYEWVEENKHYREWLVPAEVVNACGPPTVCEDEDAEYEWFEANGDMNASECPWGWCDGDHDQHELLCLVSKTNYGVSWAHTLTREALISEHGHDAWRRDGDGNIIGVSDETVC